MIILNWNGLEDTVEWPNGSKGTNYPKSWGCVADNSFVQLRLRSTGREFQRRKLLGDEEGAELWMRDSSGF